MSARDHRSSRASRSAVVSLALVVLITVFALPVLTAAASDETVADDFSSGDFTGSTGTLPWAIPWTESGEGDGSGAGSIQVRAEPNCETDPCLNLGRDVGPDATVEREANLDGYIAGTLEFDYRVHPHGAGAGTAALEISPNGGTDWYPLDSWALDTDTGMQHASYNITTRLAANTRIKFSVANNTDESHLNVDNLVITVTPPNQAPVFDQDLTDRTDAEGALINIASPATDPDGGDTLTYSATGLPDGILIDSADGTISGVLSPIAGGTHAVTITVADDGTPNLDDTDTFTWTVNQGSVFYLIAGSGGANGGDDLLTGVDPNDADPASNEMTIGTGTGTFAIDAAAVSPVSGKLFATNGG
ncbi:MAG: putative Ig domain-containing protein, partial [Acidimicrobiia bacterium]|nr:putative Ig domain-containing protein [Acidimicrobiia bacterium]